MKKRLLNLLLCPNCNSELSLGVSKVEGEEIIEGRLTCKNFHTYQIVNSIPRFVSSDSYVDSFTYEWSIFADTLLDSISGDMFSENFFQGHVISALDSLSDKLILDVGCGMGRFMELAAGYGGEVVGIDLSYAVDTA